MHALGEPLPNSVHAVSVSLPKWADVVGYEEGEKRVIDALQLGYPRFVYHPLVRKVFTLAEEKFAGAGKFCIVLPSQKVAQKCVEFCGAGRVENFNSLWAVVLPEALRAKAKEFWQHAGFIISSRQAEAFLEKRETRNEKRETEIREHLANLANAAKEDVYLFPTGMAAIFTAYEIVGASKTVQLGFPYLDTLKIQQKWGAAEFVAFEDFTKLAATKAQAVFTEFPLNPLLQQVDFVAVRNAIGATPLVIDDTLATWENCRALDHADIAVTSLTKFYSGIGDVTAGCLILNKNSPHYNTFKARIEAGYEDLLFPADAEVLWKNAQGYQTRIKKINENAAKLSDYLKNHHSSFIIHHFGGMLSLIFNKPEEAVKFYDALEVSKGPSLGTEYTLACPYTLLAHYKELDWAASCGVPAHLVRISVGCEDYADLQAKFERALLSASKPTNNK
jgi:cystathionine gamma-synthase